MSLQEYVEQLPDDEKVLIIHGYNKYQERGTVDTCEPIWVHAEAYTKEIGVSKELTHIWLQWLGMECLKYFSNKYLEEHYYNVQ